MASPLFTAMYTALPPMLNSTRPLAELLTVAVIVTLFSTASTSTSTVVFSNSTDWLVTVNVVVVVALLKL